MKGLMVALLTLLISGSVIAQETPPSNELGSFVLRLTNQDLQSLLANPEVGLISEIPEHLRGRISEVVIKLADEEGLQNGAHSTGRQDFQGAGQRPRLDPSLVQPTGTQENRQFSTNTPSVGLDAQGSGSRFGSGAPLSSRLPIQSPTRAAQDQNVSTADWISSGDDSDFTPGFMRRRNVVRPIAQTLPNNDSQFQGTKPITPKFDPGFDSNIVNRNRDLNQGAFPRQNDFQVQPERPRREQPQIDRNLQANQNRSFQRNQPLEQNQQFLPNNQFSQNNNRRQLGQIQTPQTTPQQDKTQSLLEQQQKLIAFQEKRMADLERRIDAQNQQQANPRNSSQDNTQFTSTNRDQPFRNGDRYDQEFRQTPIANPSYSFPNRHANSVVYSDQQISDPRLGVPPTRVASNNAKPITNSRITPAQIPGPNAGQDSTPDASEISKTNKSNVLADSNNLRKTNSFLLFMLLCSVGLNIYLGLISRSFYTRYAELADELRETFTATM